MASKIIEDAGAAAIAIVRAICTRSDVVVKAQVRVIVVVRVLATQVVVEAAVIVDILIPIIPLLKAKNGTIMARLMVMPGVLRMVIVVATVTVHQVDLKVRVKVQTKVHSRQRCLFRPRLTRLRK